MASRIAPESRILVFDVAGGNAAVRPIRFGAARELVLLLALCLAAHTEASERHRFQTSFRDVGLTALADTVRAVVDALDRYGRLLGTAFQIADDVLDMAGTEHETGKSLGSDLAQRKLTLPLIRLLAGASMETAGRVRELLTSGGADCAPELNRLLDESGAVDAARQTAGQFAASAQGCLTPLPRSPGRDQARRRLARWTTRGTTSMRIVSRSTPGKVM